MRTIYTTSITALGSQVAEFLDQRMIILFQENVPAELADYCVLHDGNHLEGEIQVADILRINDETYQITAVGEAVNQNLGSLGHITLSFDGSRAAELPGTLYLEAKDIPALEPGDAIQIIRNS